MTMTSDYHLLESLGSVTLLKISGKLSYKNGVNERLSKNSPHVTEAKIRMCSTNERHSHERTFCPGPVHTLPVPKTGSFICPSWVGLSYCVAYQVTFATFGDLIVMTGVELTSI